MLGDLSATSKRSEWTRKESSLSTRRHGDPRTLSGVWREIAAGGNGGLEGAGSFTYFCAKVTYVVVVVRVYEAFFFWSETVLRTRALRWCLDQRVISVKGEAAYIGQSADAY